MMSNHHNIQLQSTSLDPFTPEEIAKRLDAVSVNRAELPIRRLILLGLIGGLYIGFGAALATLVLTDNNLGYGLGRLTAGLAFSLGLIMLVVAGGELFTGNNLMVLALASRKVSVRALLRNWIVAFLANAAGAILLAFAIHYSGVLESGSIKATAIKIAEAKSQLGTEPAFIRGILCNMLVCLAVWMSVAARSFEGKAIAILFPISAFVALGFEHCIANFYLIPVGMLSGANISLLDFVSNIVPVTLGNVVGGTAIAIAYWLVYLDDNHVRQRDPSTRNIRSAWLHMQRAVRATVSTDGLRPEKWAFRFDRVGELKSIKKEIHHGGDRHEATAG
jgi:formate transporter